MDELSPQINLGDMNLPELIQALRNSALAISSPSRSPVRDLAKS